MTRTAKLSLLISMISVMIVGMGLISCAAGGSVGTSAPATATGKPAAIQLTRTAEAAAVQTIEAALAAKATPVDLEATAQALARIYVAQTAEAMPTATRTPIATKPPTTIPTPTNILTNVPTSAPTNTTPLPAATHTPEVSSAASDTGAGDISRYRTWRPDKVVEAGGTLDADTVWTAENLYIIRQDLYVPAGIKLTIQPGVIIKIAGRGPGKDDYYASAESLEQRNLFIAGTLLAEGTAEQPIIITSLQDDTVGGDTNGDASNSTPRAGNWGRIEMSTGSDDSVLRYVVIRYGGAQAIKDNQNVKSYATLALEGSSPTIQNVTISQSYSTGIWVKQQSTATIESSRIEDNGGYGIWISEGARPAIANNIIARNKRWAIGAHPEWLPQLQGNRLLGNAGNGLGLYGGQIVESSDWYLTEHPIGVLGDITVADGAQLTIQPGVTVKIAGRGPGKDDYYASAESLEQRNLFIAGTLLAEGTAEQPIVITSLQDDTVGGDTNGDASNSTPRAGNWGRIEMSTGSDDSVLRYVVIRYGGAQAIKDNQNVKSYATLALEGSSPTIQNVTISQNYSTGIWVKQQSTATIESSRIEDNGGYGIWISEGARPAIANNIIARNKRWAIGAHPEWLPQLQGNRLLGNAGNGLGLYGGQIVESSDWYLTEHPIGVLYDMTVADGAQLTIRSGVIIKIAGRGPGKDDYYASAGSLEQRNLFVAGTLLAEGTAEQPIVITSLQDDTVGGDTNGDASNSTPRAGNWGRIEMSTGSDNSVLRYVVIRYGGAQAIKDNRDVNTYATLSLKGTSPLLDNVAISDTYGSQVSCEQGAEPELVNSRFDDTNCK